MNKFSKKSVKEATNRLKIYNLWRTGELDLTMQDAGIIPSQVTKDLDLIISFASQTINE